MSNEDQFGTLPKKWSRILESMSEEELSEFTSAAQQSTYEELEKMIADYVDNIVLLEEQQEQDSDLKSLKEQVKDASSHYVLGKKINEAKKRYCVYVMHSLGKPASKD